MRHSRDEFDVLPPDTLIMCRILRGVKATIGSVTQQTMMVNYATTIGGFPSRAGADFDPIRLNDRSHTNRSPQGHGIVTGAYGKTPSRYRGRGVGIVVFVGVVASAGLKRVARHVVQVNGRILL